MELVVSAITNERFSGSQRNRKAEIAQTFANVVHCEKTRMGKRCGVPVISTTGPNVKGHRNESAQVRGRNKLHVVEYDLKVFKLIERNASKLKDDLVILHQGDILDLCTKVLHGLSSRVWLDFDLCRTFGRLSEEGLLDDLYRISQHFAHFDQVWLTLTFCLRNGNVDPYTIADEVMWNWPGLQMAVGPATYCDGAPMVTYLFRHIG